MQLRFEYRQWGKGFYEVFWLHDYNPITKRFSYQSLGIAENHGTYWIAQGTDLKAKTRKQLAELMQKRFEGVI